jgi:predicted flap endonuclease-1-like 5' DNA nuclease
MNSVSSGSLPGMTDDDLPAIGAPATRALAGAGITRLAQVAERTAAELAALHGVGPKAIGLLERALAEQGLSFRR